MWMIKTPDLFSLYEKRATKGFAFRISWTENLDRDFVMPLIALMSAIDFGDAPLADTFQQEIVTKHYTFEIGHATPLFSPLLLLILLNSFAVKMNGGDHIF